MPLRFSKSRGNGKQQKLVLAPEEYLGFIPLVLWKKKILPTLNVDETGGFQCLGHSNQTICTPNGPAQILQVVK